MPWGYFWNIFGIKVNGKIKMALIAGGLLV